MSAGNSNSNSNGNGNGVGVGIGNGNRKGPGRPPIKNISQSLNLSGIVSTPDDKNNRLEFVYSDLNIFKSLFNYLKNLRTHDIYMRCNKIGITFFARDHSKTSKVVASIAGKHVNWYYCESEFWLGLNRETVEKMFASIDKTFFKITIYQTFDDINNLNFIFNDSEIDKDCNYKIVLSSYTPDNDLFNAEIPLEQSILTKTFPIEFTLSSKQFKKTISDVSNYSDTLSFEKIGEYPLRLTYSKANIMYEEVYHSPIKIKLRSNIETNKNFRTNIKIANIKSLASSMISNEIKILCRENSDLLLYSEVGAMVIITLVQVE